MPSEVSVTRRLATALVAIAVTFCVHATWINDLGIADKRGPALASNATEV